MLRTRTDFRQAGSRVATAGDATDQLIRKLEQPLPVDLVTTSGEDSITMVHHARTAGNREITVGKHARFKIVRLGRAHSQHDGAGPHLNKYVIMRQNATLLVLLGIAAAIVAVFVYPFLRDYGRSWLIYPIGLFFVLLLFYCRQNPRPKHPRINQ